MTLKVESPGVYTSQGVPISVTGIAQVGSLRVVNMHLATHLRNCSLENERRKVSLPAYPFMSIPSLITTQTIAHFCSRL